MNPATIIDTETDSPQEVAPATSEPDAGGRAGFVESWLRKHLDMVALTVVAAGFGLRMSVASRSYLNPDELLHYLMINQPSAFLAYKASLTNAHPPLIYLLLYLVHFLSISELVLRLPSVFAGTAFCWVLFKWIEVVLGRPA